MPFRFSRQCALSEAPQAIVDAAPEGYGPETVCYVWGGTPDGSPPLEWFESIKARLGLTDAAAATLCVRNAASFLWTAFWDPTGQATPADPAVPPWPPV